MAEASASPGCLQFLKLGGSLITEKDQPHTPRPEALRRLADEIAQARAADPACRIVLGHGSGSFGHVPALKFNTRQGVHTPQEWGGFVEVWREAAALDRLVVDALSAAGLPALAFPPSASVTAADGQVLAWDLRPLTAALAAGLLPVVYGDVVFDAVKGGTILSTEDLFAHLAARLKPERILLAGKEPGVWADYPACTRLIPEITPQSLAGPSRQGRGLAPAIQGSAATDVTGGMASKVALSLRLVGEIPGLQVHIFSGEAPGDVRRSILGEPLGTLIHA